MATDHPDRAWIERTAAALASWLDVKVASPTSQLTGGGAVQHVERRLSQMHDGRHALLMPSATFAIRAVLSALGIGPGDEVLIPQLDWSATLAAVRSLGAEPIPVPVTPGSLTIDPVAAAARRTSRTRAAVACHLFAIPADVPALRRALPSITVIEDASQAFGSRLDGVPIGTLADAAIFSFGPGKRPEAGEAAAVVVRDTWLYEMVLRQSAHPIRQKHGGIIDAELAAFSVRVNPLSAVLLNYELDHLAPSSLVEQHRQLVDRLLRSCDLPLIGSDARQAVAARAVVVDSPDLTGQTLPPNTSWRHADVLDIASLLNGQPVSRQITLVRPIGSPSGPSTRAVQKRRIYTG